MEHLKKFEAFGMNVENCERCGEPTNGRTIMSKFNTDVICMKCKEDEKNDPDYKNASDAEAEEVRKGNMNYKGLRPEYKPIINESLENKNLAIEFAEWISDNKWYKQIKYNVWEKSGETTKTSSQLFDLFMEDPTKKKVNRCKLCGDVTSKDHCEECDYNNNTIGEHAPYPKK